MDGDRAARHRLLGDAELHQRFCFAEHALDQNLNFSARELGAEQARLDDLGVIENKQVTWLQQTGQIGNAAIPEILAQMEQSTLRSFGSRLLRNKLFWQRVVEIVNFHPARIVPERRRCVINGC